jgi:hypothetical protein
MNIDLRKKKLIHWIDGLNDEKVVKRLETLQNMSKEWHEALTGKELKLIDAGIAAIEADQIHSHQEVMEAAVAYLKKGK